MNILFTVLILLHLIPGIYFANFFRKNIKQKLGRIYSKAFTCIVIFLDLALLFLIWAIAFSENPFVTIGRFVSTDYSYQDLARIVWSLLFCLAGQFIVVFFSLRILTMGEIPNFRLAVSKYLIVFVLCLIPCILGFCFSYMGTKQIRIVEICRKLNMQSDTEETADKNTSYIMISNCGKLKNEISKLYVSDSNKNIQKIEITGIELDPGECYTLEMDESGKLNIKKNGGSTVFLANRDGVIIDSVNIPSLASNEIYTLEDGQWKIVSVSMEFESDEGQEGDDAESVPTPVLSEISGFYDSEFELSISVPDGYTVFYTTDSSTPTTESQKYTGKIHIYNRTDEANSYYSILNTTRDYLEDPETFENVDKCFIVRAIAVDQDGNCSDIVTGTYFVGLDQYKEDTVISLVSDPEGLFSDDNGIFVTGTAYDEWYQASLELADEEDDASIGIQPEENYLQQGMDWEREAQLQVFRETALLTDQKVGIRVQGDTSRIYIAHKRMSIYARKEYSGSNYLDVSLVSNLPEHALMLRQGALNAISQRIGEGRDVETIKCIPVVVFLDGEFWYKTYLYEKFNESNMAEKYDLSKDNIELIKNGEIDEENESEKNSFSGIFSYIESHDLTNQEYYDEFNNMVDIQSYIDMVCIQAYLANMDIDELKNTLIWHTIIPENDQEGDTRWRWGLVDMDLHWETSENADEVASYKINPFMTSGTYSEAPINRWSIFSALYSNETFQKQFALTFMDLINTNFSKNNINEIMDEYGIKSNSYSEFFDNRAEYMIPYVAHEFGLSGDTAELELVTDDNSKTIRLNTLQLNTSEFQKSEELEQYIWNGMYYIEFPVTLSTDSEKFDHWEITTATGTKKIFDATIEVTLGEGGAKVYAVFK